MKRPFLILALWLCASNTFGTTQFPERLIFEGETLAIESAPLESYFNEKNPRPDKVFHFYSSACWRGYVGTWSIKDNFLHLKSLRSSLIDPDKAGEKALAKIFKGKKAPIKATWFSGVLHASRGETLEEHFHGFRSLLTEEVYITVDKGRVTSTRVIDNRTEGATRSHEDWKWVLQADKPVKDDGRWIDARTLDTSAFKAIRESGKTYTTRGLLTYKMDGIHDNLWIPETPTTEHVSIKLHGMPKKVEPSYSAHVEITAHYKKVKDDYKLIVDSVCPLKPGETIHHPNIKLPETTSKPPKKEK